MQRRVFLSTAAGAALVGGPNVGGPNIAQAQQVVWEDVASADGRYRLKMPKGYRYLTTPAQGGTLHSYIVMLPGALTLELLDVALPGPTAKIPTVPAELQFALEGIQGGMLKSWPGGSMVLEQAPVAAGAITGRAFTISVEQGHRVVVARLYLTPAALYTQIAQGPMAERGNPVIAEFMDSLRFGQV